MLIILAPITGGVCCCTGLARTKNRGWGGVGGGGGGVIVGNCSVWYPWHESIKGGGLHSWDVWGATWSSVTSCHSSGHNSSLKKCTSRPLSARQVTNRCWQPALEAQLNVLEHQKSGTFTCWLTTMHKSGFHYTSSSSVWHYYLQR